MNTYQSTRATARLLAALLSVTVLGGCAQRMHRAIDCYRRDACAVQIGMSESAFIDLLGTQAGQAPADKASTRFTAAGRTYVVHFVPAARAPHDLTPEDGYTPYTFRDGRLVAVGIHYPPIALPELPAERAAAGEPAIADATAEPGAGPNRTSPRNRGPFKWCTSERLPSGRCVDASCC